MHYIADDLDMDAWVKAGLARLERYLACWDGSLQSSTQLTLRSHRGSTATHWQSRAAQGRESARAHRRRSFLSRSPDAP